MTSEHALSIMNEPVEFEKIMKNKTRKVYANRGKEAYDILKEIIDKNALNDLDIYDKIIDYFSNIEVDIDKEVEEAKLRLIEYEKKVNEVKHGAKNEDNSWKVFL